MRDRYDYLEFEIGDEDRFKLLLSMFEKLRKLKENGLPTDLPDIEEDPAWVDYLDEEAVNWFCKSEGWDFENTLYWIGLGWFRLIELRKEENGKGVLFYELTDMDDATPLTPLLEAFGNRVVYDSIFGRPPYSWMDPGGTGEIKGRESN
jgi:hypothetical protein